MKYQKEDSMIEFHLTPKSTPALSDKTKWDHIEDMRMGVVDLGTWHDVRVALIRAIDGDDTERHFQVDIALLKDKALQPYLQRAWGKWNVYCGHMECYEWLELLSELQGGQ